MGRENKSVKYVNILFFNPIQDGLFWGYSWIGEGKKASLPKICHTYPTMMKLGTVIPYLKKIQNYINHVTQPLSSADINIFLMEISKVGYINKYRYRSHLDT